MSKVVIATMVRFHPLVISLLIYAFSDVTYSCVIGISAFQMEQMWSNRYYPLFHSGIVLLSVLSVYFAAYSNIKLALSLHGILKLFVFLWTMHSLVFPEFYRIQKHEAVAASLYYLLTLIFEMTVFFVINKMNIPFVMDNKPLHPEIVDDEDEVMVSCC